MELLDFFKEQNFNPVALPSGDIEVLQFLLSKDGNLERLGSEDYINKLFESNGQGVLPYAKEGIPVPEISGTHSLATDVNVHFSFLTALKSYLGSDISTTLNANKDSQLVFAFESPFMDRISSFSDLDDYLNKSVLKSTNNYAKRLKDSQIYVITAVLKTTNFAIGLVDKSKLKADLKIPSIKDFVEGDLTISREGSTQRVRKYKGDKPIAFAIQVVKVQHDQTFWQGLLDKQGVFWTIKEDGFVVKGDDDKEVEFLNADKPLVFVTKNA
jgi:hypothetical protein